MDVVDNMKTLFVGFSDWVGNNISTSQNKNGSTTIAGENQNEQRPPETSNDHSVNNLKKSQSVLNNSIEQEDNFISMQNRVKSLSSLVYNTVTEVSTKIIKTLEENTILGDLNKEQEAFLQTRHLTTNEAEAVLPWIGYPNEESLKDECFSLSTDKRNFIRNPPAGVEFEFNYETSYQVAKAIMEQDSNLEKMRFDLVPKVISENQFWKNYFYRLSLICQANDLSCNFLQNSNTTLKQPSEIVTSNKSNNENVVEFVSDTLEATPQDLAEVQIGMQKLNLMSKLEEEIMIEKELDVELKHYQDLEDKSSSPDEKNWDHVLEDLLSDQQKNN